MICRLARPAARAATLLATAALAFGSPTGDTVDYERAARNFLERHGRADAVAGELTIEELVETEFLSVPLGLFELSIPRRNLATPSEPARLQGLCINLLDAQAMWVQWVRDGDKDSKDVLADLDSMRDWVEDWDTKGLAASAKDGALELGELLEATPEERELSERLATSCRTGALMGGTKELRAVRISLYPTRADFVEMLCVIGFLDPHLQPHFWVEGIEMWHQFDLAESNLRGLALSYPADGVTGPTYSSGTRMEEDNELTLGEQITQLAMNALVLRLYDENLPATAVHGLSINLVIQLFGEIDTRADGHLQGRSVAAREMFIPGGQSEGGILPHASASNRWRVNQGRHYYVRTLRQAQKDGGKEHGRGKIKHANFLLRSQDGAVRKLIQAPFLGSGVEPLPPAPNGLVEDQGEFLRAYRIAFLHWLQTNGGGSKKKSKQAFATWLTKLDELGEIESFEDSLVQVYGVPLSSPELDKHCLEGRFLLWLGRQKGN